MFVNLHCEEHRDRIRLLPSALRTKTKFIPSCNLPILWVLLTFPNFLFGTYFSKVCPCPTCWTHLGIMLIGPPSIRFLNSLPVWSRWDTLCCWFVSSEPTTVHCSLVYQVSSFDYAGLRWPKQAKISQTIVSQHILKRVLEKPNGIEHVPIDADHATAAINAIRAVCAQGSLHWWLAHPSTSISF